MEPTSRARLRQPQLLFQLLINLRGELVGINTAIISPGGGNVGIGFAVPINMARKVMDQLAFSAGKSPRLCQQWAATCRKAPRRSRRASRHR